MCLIGTGFSKFKEEFDVGAMFANWLQENKGRVYGIETRETGNKKKISHNRYALITHNCLMKMLYLKTVKYQVPLNKIMTYRHINTPLAGGG